MRMDQRSLKPVTVSAGEIAERGSFVGLGDVRNPRTDQKHGCVSARGHKMYDERQRKRPTYYLLDIAYSILLL